jgi:hypothetical protein
MTNQKPDSTGDEPSTKKENNPFSEQDKHGEKAQRAPGSQQEYQGGQPEERRAPGADDGEERKRA